MASLEQKRALVEQYCDAHREWVQTAEMHQRKYDSAMSDYANANRRIEAAQFELEKLDEDMERAEAEMRELQAELQYGENSDSSYDNIIFKLESLRDYCISIKNQMMREQEKLYEAQADANRAKALAQQEKMQYESAQANADRCQQALEQMREQLIQEADVLQTQVSSENAYASTLQGASGNMFANSALAAAGRLQASASSKQEELNGTRALIDRIGSEINSGSSNTRVLRRW